MNTHDDFFIPDNEVASALPTIEEIEDELTNDNA